MQPLYIAWTTIDSEATAHALAEGAVAARLAACAQVDGPLHVYYRWENAVHAGREWRVWYKVTETGLPALEQWVHQHHPYALPQWIAVRAEHAHAAFQQWVEDGCGPAGDGPSGK
jgi:periplasmic divalent cation tolerance protein